MKNTPKFLYASIAFTLLSGCSSAGFDGYGPIGAGTLGGAYGYSDKKVSNDSWFIEYVGVDSKNATEGANKRAQELCKKNGLAGANFTPKVGVKGTLVIASGVSKCLSENQLSRIPKKLESQELINRVKEIDVELAAFKDSRKMDSVEGFISNGLLGFVNVFDVQTQNRIKKLKVERAEIVDKLKQMSQ